MEYIEKVLGIRVRYQQWKHENDLPFYLIERYEFRQVFLDNTAAIFLYPKGKLDQMASVKKQISRIQKIENLPVVIVMKSMSRNQREYLIAAKIPFVVPDRQLYLPFIGIVLQEKFDAEILPVEQLQPSSQVLLFYYLYQEKKHICPSEVMKESGYSGMTITRAVRQLEQTGMFETKKVGGKKILTGKYAGRQLFEKMQPYLISPVRKIIYISKEKNVPDASVAGLSALSEKSMLNPPDVRCYAVYGKGIKLEGTETLMDAASQIEIELWRYDPQIFEKKGIVDTLSLAASLKNRADERTEDALDEILDKVWEEKGD